MPYEDRMADYVDVAERIAGFYGKYPEGSLQPLDPARPWTITTFGEDRDRRVFIVYTAAAYRTPDDARPGIGVAWEPFPGRTPYTRDSEIMNAETSAWGRAIAALGIATKKGIATQQDVRNRREDRPHLPPVLAQGNPPAQEAPAKPEPDEKASLAADFAVNAAALVKEGGTVDDLKKVVYEPAKTARCLRAMVDDPFEEGMRCQLSAVITHAKKLIENTGGQS